MNKINPTVMVDMEWFVVFVTCLIVANKRLSSKKKYQ